MAEPSKYQSEIEALGRVLDAVESLDSDSRQWVFRTASDRLGLPQSAAASSLPFQPVPAVAPSPHTPIVSPSHPAETTEPKSFMDAKQPSTDVERVACLGYYLAHFRKQTHFRTGDVNSLNTEAAGPNFSNPSVAMQNAEKQGYLTRGKGKGEKQISSFGEKIVDAMPDREAVQQVRLGQKKRRSGRKRGKKKTTD